MLWIFTDFQFDFKIQLQFLVFVRSLRKLRYYCKLSRLSTSCRIASTLNDKILVNRQFFYDLAKLIIRFHLLGLITLQTAFLKFSKKKFTISQTCQISPAKLDFWSFSSAWLIIWVIQNGSIFESSICSFRISTCAFMRQLFTKKSFSRVSQFEFWNSSTLSNFRQFIGQKKTEKTSSLKARSYNWHD